MKVYEKFLINDEILYLTIEEEGDVITLTDELGEMILEEFYIFSDAERIFERASKFLRKMEERGETLYQTREKLREFIGRELERLALASL